MTPPPPRTILPNGLPDIQRLITTHNADGKAVISNDMPSTSAWKEISPAANFFLAYTTQGFPVNFAGSDPTDPGSVPTDLRNYEMDMRDSEMGLSLGNGTVLRFVDFAPNGSREPWMHRTLSIDYGVVLEGKVELVLDSGESRVMRRGDVCVQRGTMHAWKNVSEDGAWARMMFVLVSAHKVRVGGRELGESIPGRIGDAGGE